MNELIERNGDADVRWPRRGRAEEDKVASFEVGAPNSRAEVELVRDRPGDDVPLLAEDVGYEPAAVESGRIRSSVKVRHAAERERRVYQGSTRAGDRVGRPPSDCLSAFGRAGKRTRHRAAR
jgi:hypothetical protein